MRASLLIVVSLVHLARCSKPDVPLRYSSTATRMENLTMDFVEGETRGFIHHAQGGPVAYFHGVPYAQPPIGNLRFRPPQPIDGSRGVFKAYHKSPPCYQYVDNFYPGFWGSEMWNAKGKMTEDCLSLDVWFPYGPEYRNLPVLVWIFGGGFYYGSPSLDVYEGMALARENKAVVININYRVGPLGFLFLNDSKVPGNMGLLDQQLALQWINDHIALFNGDREKITLMGESAGAASVSAHLLAPGSQDLFKRAILQSATINNPWAVETTDKAYEKGMALVKKTGCSNEKMDEVIDCLQSQKAQNLTDEMWRDEALFMEFPFVIVNADENFFQGKNILKPVEDLEFPQKDVLLGFCEDEGTFFTAYQFEADFGHKNFPDKPPNITQEKFNSSLNTVFPGVKYIGLRRYLLSAKLSDYAAALNSIVGISSFICDLLRLAEHLDDGSRKVYVYQFTQRSSTNPWPKWMGVMHGYEIEYVFGIPVFNQTQENESDDPRHTPEEIEFSKQIMQYWVSFANTGKPETNISRPAFDRVDQKWGAFKSGEYNPEIFELAIEPDPNKSKHHSFCVTSWKVMIESMRDRYGS